jgi:hypothetical protein
MKVKVSEMIMHKSEADLLKDRNRELDAEVREIKKELDELRRSKKDPEDKRKVESMTILLLTAQ